MIVLYSLFFIKNQFNKYNDWQSKQLQGYLYNPTEILCCLYKSQQQKEIKVMSRYKIQREYIFSSKPYQQISDFLKEYPKINLKQVRDQKLNTALHQAAYNSNDLRILKKYLDYMQKYYANFQKQDPSGMFKFFVNMGNQDGMTALHFAAYKGNFKALEMLCNYGADYSKVTTSGHNVLHLAAQSGTVETFIFFQSLVDINSKDNKNSTPLHWACYMNNQSIVTFLLAQSNIDVNAKDQKNQTPLHLATTYGHTKLVKKLLRAGGNPRLQNSSGETPLKIARDNQFKNIEKILNYQHGCLDYLKLYFNLKTVYRPESRSLQKPALYIFCMLLAISLRILFLQYSSQYYFISYAEYAYQFILILVYLSLIKPPSSKRPQKYIDFLNGNTNMKRVCLACALVKPRRSFHCQVCKVCIQRYDHHCYWINNCIGKHNLGRFIFFIIMFQILLLYFIWASILTLTQFFTQDEYPIHAKQDYTYYAVAYSFTIGIFSFCFSFPMIALNIVHINNLFLNKTTYQRFTKDKISTLTQSTSHLLQEQLRSKKNNEHSLSNAIAMCKDNDINQEDNLRSSINSFNQS